jgi:hypothetical protein
MSLLPLASLFQNVWTSHIMVLPFAHKLQVGAVYQKNGLKGDSK